jgi:hypothetical protein
MWFPVIAVNQSSYALTLYMGSTIRARHGGCKKLLRRIRKSLTAGPRSVNVDATI